MGWVGGQRSDSDGFGPEIAVSIGFADGKTKPIPVRKYLRLRRFTVRSDIGFDGWVFSVTKSIKN